MVIRLFQGEGLSKDWVSYDEVSPNVFKAVIAGEDARFCEHFGFDLEAIRKALQHNKKSHRLRGASTITQQTAKNLFLWPGRDLVRKGFEAYFAVLLELFWDKRRILEVYVNVVEFGHGIYGVEAAAQAYYKKSAKDLTAEEAARLAADSAEPAAPDAAAPGRRRPAAHPRGDAQSAGAAQRPLPGRTLRGRVLTPASLHLI